MTGTANSEVSAHQSLAGMRNSGPRIPCQHTARCTNTVTPQPLVLIVKPNGFNQKVRLWPRRNEAIKDVLPTRPDAAAK